MENRKPSWLRVKIHSGRQRKEVEDILARLSLNTVCREAKCPNHMECFSRRTATFMILGNVCTRNCTFCNVQKGIPGQVDVQEPERVSQAVKELGLKHAVITSVTRDDLKDGGASHFANVINEIRKLCTQTSIEVLIPDFKGDFDALRQVIEVKPEIINHNIETVPRLYTTVRPMAVYERSLELLERVKSSKAEILSKSGIMVGVGESRDEVIATMRDLRQVDCDILTIGQYLSPSKAHHRVVEFIQPELFEEYKQIALEMGFKYVASSPFVRSSYHADEALEHKSNKHIDHTN